MIGKKYKILITNDSLILQKSKYYKMMDVHASATFMKFNLSILIFGYIVIGLERFDFHHPSCTRNLEYSTIFN